MKIKNLKPRLQALDTRRVPTLKPADPDGVGAWRADKRGANQRGYTYAWQKASKDFLAKHPLCQCPDCDEGRKRVTPATVVDHHIPHRGDKDLFWDSSNWRAMSKACHDLKTKREH